MKSFKTTSLLAFCCTMAVLLASCAGDPEFHELTPIGMPQVHYADQLTDSVVFSVTDSWKVTSLDSWIKVNGIASGDIAHDYRKRYECTVPLLMGANSTGRTRQGYVKVEAYEYSFTMPYTQVGFLNITHPTGKVESLYAGSNTIPDVVSFELTDSLGLTADSICFNVHGYWTLSHVDPSAASWLQIDTDGGLPGKARVGLTLVPNTDPDKERSTDLVLTSNGIGNIIKVRQLARKK